MRFRVGRMVVTALTMLALGLPGMALAAATSNVTVSLTLPSASARLTTASGSPVSSVTLADGPSGGPAWVTPTLVFNDQSANSTYTVSAYTGGLTGSSGSIPASAFAWYCGGYGTSGAGSFTPDATGCTAVWNTGLASSSASATSIDEAVPQADPYTELRFGVNPPASAASGTYTGTITVIGN